MKSGFFTRLIQVQTQIEFQPSKCVEFMFWVRSVISKSWSSKFDYQRFLRINRLPNSPLNADNNPPPIDLLLVTKSEDINLLKTVIEHAIKNCMNRISKIIIVVPSIEVKRVKKETSKLATEVNIEVRDEEVVIPKKIRDKLRVEFPILYGWVLAQFLKIWTVADSDSQGVLVLDADTILLSPRVYLSTEDRQVLMPSNEYHQPYYNFLHNYGSYFGDLQDSFISHHMLMQPKYAREALEVWKNSIDLMADSVCENYDKFEKNPFCVCFEVYAQYMVHRHNDKILLAKWGNLSVKRPDDFGISLKDITTYYSGKFHSISMHSWL